MNEDERAHRGRGGGRERHGAAGERQRLVLVALGRDDPRLQPEREGEDLGRAVGAEQLLGPVDSGPRGVAVAELDLDEPERDGRARRPERRARREMALDRPDVERAGGSEAGLAGERTGPEAGIRRAEPRVAVGLGEARRGFAPGARRGCLPRIVEQRRGGGRIG